MRGDDGLALNSPCQSLFPDFFTRSNAGIHANKKRRHCIPLPWVPACAGTTIRRVNSQNSFPERGATAEYGVKCLRAPHPGSRFRLSAMGRWLKPPDSRDDAAERTRRPDFVSFAGMLPAAQAPSAAVTLASFRPNRAECLRGAFLLPVFDSNGCRTCAH